MPWHGAHGPGPARTRHSLKTWPKHGDPLQVDSLLCTVESWIATASEGVGGAVWVAWPPLPHLPNAVTGSAAPYSLAKQLEEAHVTKGWSKIRQHFLGQLKGDAPIMRKSIL